MSPEEIKKAMDVVAAEDGKAAIDILKNLIASLAGGEPPPVETEAAAEVPDPPVEEEVASVAASREILHVLGAKTPGEATAALKSLVDRVASLDADRAALDLSERQGLVAKLVTAGAETPATAWADAAKRTPKPRLMSEPIAELRERVTALVKASRASGHAPPESTVIDEKPAPRPLSRAEITACKKRGMTEAEFIAAKASIVVRNK
jgi:hypothetical protein